MHNFLNRISIKTFLMGMVGLLLVVLTALSLNIVMTTYWDSKEVSRVGIANELSDQILEAAKREAKERGVTNMALSSNAAADGQTVQMIQELRTKGDEALKKAYALAEDLSKVDGTNKALLSSLQRSHEVFSGLEAARKTVDANIYSAVKTYSSQEWVKAVTSSIEANAEVRIAAFASTASTQTLQEALHMNIELKNAIWLVSEYAGRERALVARLIASKKPADMDAVEHLNTYRAIVDMNLKPILRLKDSNGVDPKVLGTVAKLEEVFMGRFGSTRKAVYAAMSTGDYPMTGSEWIEKSSEAIDTVVDVSGAVGQMVESKVAGSLRSAKWNMSAAVGVLAAIVAMGLVTLWVIKNKVINPMVYLNKTMTEIAKTGDLTLHIEVKSQDESGQMASTFNGMMHKFNDIIQDIHASVAQLASSSEELSASATQIASGSQSQDSKAAQVSTASQEMSATLIEVARNVSEAADAARLASGVAVKGGKIVSETIESMNGIATTAKESKEIISLLGSRSKDIGNIVNVIDDIADQTNLLALNAAIEAARAGDQGRGFAVVADEVRKLAEKTMKATKEIGDMIKAMQDETQKAITSTGYEVQAVENGVKLASAAGESLKEIVAKVDVVTTMMQQITTASEQQSAATEQITHDIETVAGVITDTASSAQQIARASEEIAQLATGLKGTVEMFKVAGASGAGSAAGKVIPMKEKGGRIVQMDRPAMAAN
ncbi:MAG: HAMP domain-containing protein [Deltaproteobacteria bacterium]|nr:HAMP domain-containing protein [Deltaproteobacteria bacterium]